MIKSLQDTMVSQRKTKMNIINTTNMNKNEHENQRFGLGGRKVP